MRKLAYWCRDVDNENHEIYFCKSNIEARKIFANTYNEGELGGIHVNRIDWADRFAKLGYVPNTVLIDNGWWMECRGCGRKVSEHEAEEYLYDLEYTGGKDTDYFSKGYGPIEPIDSGRSLYCNKNCMEASKKRQDIKQNVEKLCYDWMSERLKEKLPLATIKDDFGSFYAYITVNDSGDYLVKDCYLGFSTPVTKYDCRLQLSSDKVNGQPDYKGLVYTCSAYDEVRFKKFIQDSKNEQI